METIDEMSSGPGFKKKSYHHESSEASNSSDGTKARSNAPSMSSRDDQSNQDVASGSDDAGLATPPNNPLSTAGVCYLRACQWGDPVCDDALAYFLGLQCLEKDERQLG